MYVGYAMFMVLRMIPTVAGTAILEDPSLGMDLKIWGGILMSVFSIEFGGPHSGFLIALLDALSFTATGIFYFFGGDLAKQSWGLFLTVLVAISVWSAVTTFVFLKGEASRLTTPRAFDE
jgi:hypothetical protein